jgi:uncharacterized repeat protein (TIGR01451 family)
MSKFISLSLITFFIVILTTLSARPAQAADPVVPGNVRIDATFEHIGVVWWITGDDDLDSAMTLEFRRLGESVWQPGALAMRAYPSIIVDGAQLERNYWGASALFLEPGQTYDLRLTLTDPDGGSETRVVTGSTRTQLQPDPAGRELYVESGNGGGSGSLADPFQGLQAAANAAQPGDTFHVAAGIYYENNLELNTSGTAGHPITFMGPESGTAIIDGDGDRGVFTLVGSESQPIEYIIIKNLTIQDGDWGIDAQNSRNLFIHHNTIGDVDYGIYNRRENGVEGNQTICDNVIQGRTTWPGSGIPGERGIDLRGSGNVVCHNTVQYFGDCVSVQPFTSDSFGNDVYGNDAAFCVDDGIEIDYNMANARVWRNRVMNTRMGVSVQPIRGGPAYIFRNEFFNQESVPIKMHNQTTGFYVVHNTGVKHNNGHGDNGSMWRNATFRNNLFLGTYYAFEFTTVPDQGFRDFDYDAWGTTRSSYPFFKWNDVRYNTLADLPAGVEDHGVEAEFDDLINATLPANWNVAAPPGTRDLRLVNGAAAIDGGINLPNLNDAFTLSGAPDMGAFEYNQPLPHYGPRPEIPDLSNSYKNANPIAAEYGETVTYTITLQNGGAELTDMVTLTDTLPPGLTYVVNSLTASAGTWNQSAAPSLTWLGNVDGNTPVVITYAATIDTSDTRIMLNSVTVNAGSAGILTRSATVLANGEFVFLPIIMKSSP